MTQEHEFDTPQRGEVYAITAYEADRAYGGPEEGGWYYRIGTFIRVMRMIENWDAAVITSERANRHLSRLCRHNLPLDHPYYNGGVYFTVPILVETTNGVFREPPDIFPEIPPKYREGQL